MFNYRNTIICDHILSAKVTLQRREHLFGWFSRVTVGSSTSFRHELNNLRRHVRCMGDLQGLSRLGSHTASILGPSVGALKRYGGKREKEVKSKPG